MNLNGDTEVSVEGLARVSPAALATAQGSCAFIAEKRFPKKPLSKADRVVRKGFLESGLGRTKILEVCDLSSIN